MVKRNDPEDTHKSKSDVSPSENEKKEPEMHSETNHHKEKDQIMHTALRITRTVDSNKLTLEFPELELLMGREVEILILVNGMIDDGSEPPKGIQNSPHVAGSYVLDEEAMQQFMANRFK